MKTNWWSPRAWRLHISLAICLPVFLILGNWQLHRALAGNTLSWAYTFEWPLFACYACYLWWRLLHDDADSERRALKARSARATERDEREAEEMRSYNAYLAKLNAEEESDRT